MLYRYFNIIYKHNFSRIYSFPRNKIPVLDIEFSQKFDPKISREWKIIKKSNFSKLLKNSLNKKYPDVSGRNNKKKLYKLISSAAEYQIRNIVKNDINVIGTSKKIWVLANDDVDMLIKGHIDRNLPEDDRRIDNQELAWIEILESQNLIKKVFNKTLFTSGDSSQSEQAGILGALIGSLFVLQ